MAIPVLAGWNATSGGATTSSTITLTKPSGVATNDLLVLIVGSDDNSGATQWNAVTGYTQIVGYNSATADADLAIYWRLADGTEAATQAVTTTFAVNVYGWYLRITGVDTTTPINVVGTATEFTSTSHPIPAVTTTAANCLAIYALAFDGGDGAPFSVSGTGWAEISEQTAGTGATDGSGCFGTKDQAVAGSTGTATVTSTVSDSSSCVQIAVAGTAGGVSASIGELNSKLTGGMVDMTGGFNG